MYVWNSFAQLVYTKEYLKQPLHNDYAYQKVHQSIMLPLKCTIEMALIVFHDTKYI
jgi:hypothetical protein